jgi:hypothetical protein
MTTYVPAKGKRIPMPNGQPDWPEEGREVNFARTYEARLVADGDLVEREDQPQVPPAGNGRNK